MDRIDYMDWVAGKAAARRVDRGMPTFLPDIYRLASIIVDEVEEAQLTLQGKNTRRQRK